MSDERAFILASFAEELSSGESYLTVGSLQALIDVLTAMEEETSLFATDDVWGLHVEFDPAVPRGTAWVVSDEWEQGEDTEIPLVPPHPEVGDNE